MLYKYYPNFEYKSHFAAKAFWIVNPENNNVKELYGIYFREFGDGKNGHETLRYKFFVYYNNGKKYIQKFDVYIPINRYNIDNLAVDDFTEEGVALAITN